MLSTVSVLRVFDDDDVIPRFASARKKGRSCLYYTPPQL